MLRLVNVIRLNDEIIEEDITHIKFVMSSSTSQRRRKNQ